MKKNKQGFTLVEIIITLGITGILLVILVGLYPNLVNTFGKQKDELLFQQSLILDNFYINKKITGSQKTLTSYSSGAVGRYNSYLSLLNKPGDIHYSTIYLGNETGKIFAGVTKQEGKIIVKNNFFYSGFAQVGNTIYFTNPGNHTINRYISGSLVSEVVYGVSGSGGYNNDGLGLFNTPTGITTDGTNLYVSDTGNHVIRKIELSSGTITKVAGIAQKSGYNDGESFSSGTSSDNIVFDTPTGITTDGTNLYVSDTFNNRIRKINLTSMISNTIIGSDNYGYNVDFGNRGDIHINYPLAVLKVNNGIIFSDTLNGKIRYYNEGTGDVKTIVGLENINHYSNHTISKYMKNFYISNIVEYLNGFYFNDIYNSVIYKYDFGDGIIGNSDDVITKFLGNTDRNILINGDFENEIGDINNNNDIGVQDIQLFTTIDGGYYVSPISGKKCLAVKTKGKTASGVINFLSNPNDGDRIQIYDKIFEFDDGNLIYNQGNILIPIGDSLNDTLDNFVTELGNYNIINKINGNKINVIYNNYGVIGNNAVFSGSSSMYSFSPNSGKLSGGVDYNTGNFSFYFDKELKKNEKYKLTFYISSDSRIDSSVLEPILTIKTGTGNLDEKILNIDNKWIKKEIVFDGKGEKQRIEFLIKNGVNIYFDNMKLLATSNLENLDLLNKNNFKLQLLNNFYVTSSGDLFLIDAMNKRVFFIQGNIYKIINNNFHFFDIYSLYINLKNDYLGNAILETLKYTFDSNSINYTLGKSDYILRLSNNTK